MARFFAIISGVAAIISVSVYAIHGVSFFTERLKEKFAGYQLESVRQYKSEGFRLFKEGETASAHERYGQAAAILKPLADSGIREAEFELGKLFCVGWGVGKSREMAVEYFRQADLTAAERLRLAKIPDLSVCLPEVART